MHPPLVGIPSYGSEKDPDDATLFTFRMTQTYIQRLEAAGAAPFIIPLLQREPALRAIYETLDGLLLAGGGDVAPSFFGESPHPELESVNRDRDRVELTLLRWAFEDRLPILAICRGIQVLNVGAGGTLYQDIEDQIPDAGDHRHPKPKPYDYRAHEVAIEPDSRLSELMGGCKTHVNSLHHQAVKDVAPGFRVTARAGDQVIEGIELVDDHFAVGVQWHPELLAAEDPVQQALFDGFMNAVHRFRTNEHKADEVQHRR